MDPKPGRLVYTRVKHSYRVHEPFEEYIPEFALFNVDGPLFSIRNGWLRVEEGFCWDGDTYGPDTEASRRASLVHDIGCQCKNEGLAPDKIRKFADLAYLRLCRRAGMWFVRARARFRAISIFGRVSGRADPDAPRVAL